MATPKQIAANRANAKKSRGPITQSGKEKVSQNRTTHGLLGRFRVMDGENQADYDAFLEEFIRDEKPVGLHEMELVKKMAQQLWLSHRALRLQNGCFVKLGQTKEQAAEGKAEIGILADLERFTKYHTQHDRAYSRALADLLKLRKERRLAEIGFEREKRAQAAEQRRENREIRQAETHKVRQATAKVALQLKEVRLLAVMTEFRSQSLLPEGSKRQKTAA